MKNSGIEWIGMIPKDWEIKKVKNCFYISKEQAHDNNPTVLSLARAGVKIRDISNNEGQLAASYENYNPVKPGDLLLNPMDLYSGANCSMSEVSGVISPAYVNLRKKVDLNPKYYDYYFKTQYWTMSMFAHGKGVSFDNRWTMNSDTVLNYYLPFPSFEEQDRIVKIINKKILAIDSLIEIENQQIDKLTDYKYALIRDTVFLGLNHKDTRYATNYIGNISNNFKLMPIGSIFKIKKDIIGRTPDTVLSITQSGLKVKNIHLNEGQMAESYDKYQIVSTGDFAMNHMDLLTGWIDISSYNGVTSPDYRVFNIINSNFNKKYFLYVFQIYYKYRIFFGFGQGVSNLGRWRLPANNFLNILIPVPEGFEQCEIVNYLEQKCSIIEKLISLKQDKIKKLEDYKKSLIYEYVTGKKVVVA